MTKLNMKRQKMTDYFHCQKNIAYEKQFNRNTSIEPECNEDRNKRLSEKLSYLSFYSEVINLMMNYISQYDDNMTKEMEKII